MGQSDLLERTRRVVRDQPPPVDDRDAVGEPIGFPPRYWVVSTTVGPIGISDDLLDYPISLVLALTIGCGVRVGRARAELLEERSARLARDHRNAPSGPIERERAHIARELPDIVAHNVSVIVAPAAILHRIGR